MSDRQLEQDEVSRMIAGCGADKSGFGLTRRHGCLNYRARGISDGAANISCDLLGRRDGA
jgi:hypothetical protein